MMFNDEPAVVKDWMEFVQTSGYPMLGEAKAITYFRPPSQVEIHALLSYDDRGYLQGALMYFPQGSPLDQPGAVTVIVRPKRRRKGIGRTLLLTALMMWPSIDLKKQAYTPEGRALVDSLSVKPLGGKS